MIVSLMYVDCGFEGESIHVLHDMHYSFFHINYDGFKNILFNHLGHLDTIFLVLTERSSEICHEVFEMNIQR